MIGLPARRTACAKCWSAEVEPGARIDHEQDRVAIDKRCFRLRAHAARERLQIAFLEACGVDDGEGKVRDPALALAAVAGDARLIVDQGQPAADQPVEQRRLADVRPADDRDLGAHVVRVRDGLILRSERSLASRRMLQLTPTFLRTRTSFETRLLCSSGRGRRWRAHSVLERCAMALMSSHARRRRPGYFGDAADRFEAIRPSQRLAACRSSGETSGSPSTRSNCFAASS